MATVDWIANPMQAGAMKPALGGDDEDRRSESALVRAAQGGSEEALETLFRRHWRDAHRAAFLIVRDAGASEDIAQEAFLAAIRALDRFDRRRPFRPWLHRIVVNRAIDHARARALRREVHEEVAGETVAAPCSSELDDDLISALAELGVEQRAVIVLRYLFDYTPGEISRILDIPRGTVNSRLRRGLDQLAHRLVEEAT
ncbi:MAG: RNA polymerase sigma factor [Chloroflexota bacterium]